MEHKTAAYLPIHHTGEGEFLLGFTGAAMSNFRRYYIQLMQAELIQGIGRLRANCRGGAVEGQPPKTLKITVIGDVAIPMPVTLVDFKKVIPKAMAESLAVLEEPDKLFELATKIQESGEHVRSPELGCSRGAPLRSC